MFLVSVASKGFRVFVSSLFSTLTIDVVSVDSKVFTGRMLAHFHKC